MLRIKLVLLLCFFVTINMYILFVMCLSVALIKNRNNKSFHLK